MITSNKLKIGKHVLFKENKEKIELIIIGIIEDPFIYLKLYDKATKQIYYYEWGNWFIEKEQYDFSKEKQLTEKEQELLRFIMR